MWIAGRFASSGWSRSARFRFHAIHGARRKDVGNTVEALDVCDGLPVDLGSTVPLELNTYIHVFESITVAS